MSKAGLLFVTFVNVAMAALAAYYAAQPNATSLQLTLNLGIIASCVGALAIVWWSHLRSR
jgi:hypothetical protein